MKDRKDGEEEKMERRRGAQGEFIKREEGREKRKRRENPNIKCN